MARGHEGQARDQGGRAHRLADALVRGRARRVGRLARARLRRGGCGGGGRELAGAHRHPAQGRDRHGQLLRPRGRRGRRRHPRRRAPLRGGLYAGRRRHRIQVDGAGAGAEAEGRPSPRVRPRSGFAIPRPGVGRGRRVGPAGRMRRGGTGLGSRPGRRGNGGRLLLSDDGKRWEPHSDPIPRPVRIERSRGTPHSAGVSRRRSTRTEVGCRGGDDCEHSGHRQLRQPVA